MNANILDFGTEKIIAKIGKRGLNDSIIIVGSGESDYAGFCNGEFLEPFKLPEAVAKAIKNAEYSARSSIEHIVVGVPGEFTTCICKDVQTSLTKKRKVLTEDIDLLHEEGDKFKDIAGYTLINSQPIYYTLDDGVRLIDPIGLESSKLGGHISYVLAENRFLEAVKGILKQMGITSVEFVSNLVAESMFLFDDVMRDRFVVFFDCGHLTTTIAVTRGDGVLAQYNVALGGGHITEALSHGLDISLKHAEALKRKITLNLNVGDDDVYSIHSTDSSRADIINFNAKRVNEIVAAFIKLIAQTITKSLKLCTYDYPDYIPYHLTGGGLAYIKGAPELLSKHLKRPIEVVAPNLPLLENHPCSSSSYALLDTALRIMPQPQEKPIGFFRRLFRRK